MNKKFLLSGFTVTMTLTLLTACGSSKKEESTMANADVQSTSQAMQENYPEEDYAQEDLEFEEDEFAPEEICAMYYDYMYGLLPEDEFVETLEAIYGTTLDEAESIFDEHGEEYGYKIYEMSDEILNSKVGDQIMQIGDVVVQFPCTVGNLAESTNAELISAKDAKKIYRAFEEVWLYCNFDSLETLGESGGIFLKTSDGSVLYCKIMGDGELHRAPELYINQIITGSNNVFLAGGIHTGLSMEETDAILESNLGDGMTSGKWVSKSSSENRNKFLLISASNYPDRDWEKFPSGSSDEIVVVRTDTEGASVYYLETWFGTPYDN